MKRIREFVPIARRPLAALFVIGGLALAGACYEDEATSPLAGGSTRILLTDAPWPYDSVARVDLYIVQIQATTQADTTSLGQWWWTVTEPHRAFNLLDLQQGEFAIVGEGELPPDQYRAVRMVIDTDSTKIWAKADVDASGNPIPGRNPLPVDWQSSAGRPSLYAFVEGNNAVTTAGAEIVIDFDVGRSFFPQPNGGFIFSPVLRAVNRASTGAITGTVRGDTLSESPGPVADVTITVYTGNIANSDEYWSVRATGKTDANGNFKIDFLLPGTYIVRSDAPRSSPYSPGVRASVQVVQGQITSGVDITLPRRAAATFEVFPEYRTLATGRTDSLYAYATDDLGRVIVGAEITWSSSDTTKVRVTPAANQSSIAFIEARAAGSANVTATWGTYSDYSSIIVAADTTGSGHPSVATVTVYPGSVNAYVGDSLGFVAALKDSVGQPIYGRPIYWLTSDSTVLVPYCCGVFRAIKAGSATVTATSEGKSGTASVVVIP